MLGVNEVDRLRLSKMLKMLRDVSRAASPQDVLGAFGQRFAELNPMDYYVALSVRELEPGQYKVTRQLDLSLPMQQAMQEFRESNPWGRWEEIPTRRGGFLGGVIRRAQPQLFHDLDLSEDPVLGDALADMRSAVASPLFDGGRPLNWAISFRRDPQGYTPADLELSFLASNLIGASTRAMLALQQKNQLAHALTQQFEQLARVQQSLLPKRLPPIPGVRIATSYLTSQHAGGDYYDFHRFEDGRWGILIADVSGHGAAAATVMAMLHAMLPEASDSGVSPESLVRDINRRLHRSLDHGTFVTAFFALYDHERRHVAYVRAGHNPPRLRRRSGEIVALDGAGGLPLGLTEGYDLVGSAVDVVAGDSLLLYTDGIVEARAPGGDLFGVERLDEAVGLSDGSPQAMIDAVHAAVFHHTGSRARDDDQTMVALQFGEANEPG